QALIVEVGASQQFSVSASAPAGHALSTQWFVDREAAANGDHFSYAPTPAEVGVHSVGVLVSDTSAGGRSVRLQWVVGVLPTAVKTEPPTILPSITPHPNAGWNNTDVTVSWSVIDLYSGVASANGCTTSLLAAETAGSTLTCSATNGLGLSQAQSVTVRIDKTAPTSTASASRPVNGRVTVDLAAADGANGAGVHEIRYALQGAETGGGVLAGNTGSVTIAAQGTSYLIYSASDNAGNREPLKVLTIHNQTGVADYVVASDFAVSLFATGFATHPAGFGPDGPIGLAFDSANILFVADTADGFLYKFGAAGGVAGPATRVNATAISGSPVGLAFTRDGRLYMTRPGAGDVVEVNPSTGAIIRTVAAGQQGYTGLATDPISGDLFVTNPPRGLVQRISNFANGPGTMTTYASTGYNDGIAFGPDGTLYVAVDMGVATAVKITGTNAPAPGVVTAIAPVYSLDGLAVAASDDPTRPPALFANRNDGKITKIDLTTSPPALSDIVSNGTRGDFVTVGPDGCLYATQSATVLKVTNADGTCGLAPTGSLPQLRLSPPLAAREVGTPQMLAARFNNVSAPAGTMVTFAVSGAHTQSATVTTDASGQATFAYTGSVEGIDQVVATAGVNGKSVTSNPATVTWAAAPDTLPPSTVATATPAPNAFGWNNTAVTIQLTAVDNPGGSGIKEIHYALAGAQSTSNLVAGSSATVPLTAAGVTTLTYFAIDNAGNQEPPQSLTVRIDKDAPASTAIHLPSATPVGWNTTAVMVRIGAADTPSGSGVRDIQSTLSGAQTGGATMAGSFAAVSVSAEGITTVAYAATDRAENQETASHVTVRIDTSAPTTIVAASPAANAAGWNNTDVLVSLSAQDSQGGSGVQQISYAVSGAQTSAGVVAGGSGSVLLSTPGVSTITAFATDNAGNAGPVQTRTVRIDKIPPTVYALLAPLPDAQGHNTTPVTVSLHGVDSGGAGVKELHYTVSGAQTGDSLVAGGHAAVTISAVGTTTIRAVATDNAGNTGPASMTTVMIIPPDTTPPVTTNVAAAPNPAAITTPVSLTATVSDVATGGSNIASAEYALDGGSFSAMAAQDGAFDSPTELVTVNIAAFPTAGVHNLCVRGTDVTGNVGSPRCVLLAVYDPSAGFVTGGGWIDSPAGACQISAVCQGAVGRANFGFVAKYQRGATVPTGQTEFQFQAGNLNFHAESYQWLVVSGAKAQYKGTGTINGSGTYGFMLSAIDGALPGGRGADKFRIKITDSSGNVVYDNQLGAADSADPTTVIAGGNIVIHSS
ncbi:MAG: OmpL47-type beta-barrel domain-containing protein, partial [Roseiflexaceae bacterium]